MMIRLRGVVNLTNLLQDGLNIPQIVNQIREDDHIKLFAKVQCMCVRVDKAEIWMAPSSRTNHLF